MKKNFLYIASAFIILLVSVCTKEHSAFNIDCDDCTYQKPDSANLIVYITINDDNPYVPLVFYRGKIEEGIIEWVDTSRTDRLELYSPVNEYYSLKAIYKKGEKTIIAIDGDKLNTRQVSEVCDRDCWIITGGILDVRLK